MDKLPPTSYIRMVDIWLIFVQLYPFIQEIHNAFIKKDTFSICNIANYHYVSIQVVLSTIIELDVEEELTNDHGFRRFVPESQNKNTVCIVCFHEQIFKNI